MPNKSRIIPVILTRRESTDAAHPLHVDFYLANDTTERLYMKIVTLAPADKPVCDFADDLHKIFSDIVVVPLMHTYPINVACKTILLREGSEDDSYILDGEEVHQ